MNASAPLSPELRRKLEDTVIEAREIAEAGARAALEALAVHYHEPFPHQTPEQRKLRNRLRAHARQLGDTQSGKGTLALDRLVHECAYEHWHRMLFARFLAENDFLIEHESGVAISLEECEDLAQAAGIDQWTYASRCAQQMLPQIFRADDPLLQVALAGEYRVKLERLLAGLESTVFKADDALGWVYQFWQSKRKDDVNASGEKITGDTLPAVTQLFTEHYMVLFLLHNTIGAWHAGKALSAKPELAESAASEDVVREAVALSAGGGYSFDYLRCVRGADGTSGPWRPAAGTFAGWPTRAAQIRVLDPCCGSGHFLVAAFELLVKLRMQEEGFDLSQAVDAVLRDNLFGLELDARCTQIAAFNLALAAWKLTGFRTLPQVNIACSGLSVGGTKEQWLQILAREGDQKQHALFAELHDLFSKASTLGSLINPQRFFGSDWLGKQGMDNLLRALRVAVAEVAGAPPERHELGVAAQGFAKAAELLAGRYTLVLTNVPYLGRGKQDDVLKKHLETQYPLGKADLATAFVLRSLEFCEKNGSIALVTPQNWLFLTTYTKLRQTLLEERTWNFVARLGEHAFESAAAAGAFAAMVLLSATTPAASAMMAGIDVSAPRGQTPIRAREKAGMLRASGAAETTMTRQREQLENPDACVLTDSLPTHHLLSEYADSFHGISTTDYAQFGRVFWELPCVHGPWVLQQSTVESTIQFGGREHALLWEGGHGRLQALRGTGVPIVITGLEAWNRVGVAVSQMDCLPVTIYEGECFDDNTGVIVPKDRSHSPALWAFCSSEEYSRLLRIVDQSIKVTYPTLVKVPFDLPHWQQTAAEKYPHGLPEPESDDPTQWLFHGRPEESTSPLQVAVARMLGYRWPAELDEKMRLSARARALVARCEDLLRFADRDGIVCIPSVRGEDSAADRLLALLTACGIAPDRDLDEWLRDGFFEEHCALFHQRPFIWHIWDGRKRDGFHALVSYHKLAEGGGKGRKLLESLTYSYLGDWIGRQQDGVKRGEEGAEDRLAAAIELQKRLVAILEGEPPFDIFVRWKPLAEQAIGWEPDINDGVRMNIRPFLASDIPSGKKGAGVLRAKPKVKWDKDRGKEPARSKHEFPWFWGWNGGVDFAGASEFTGERFNDCHYTVARKRTAREEAAAATRGAGR